MHSVQVIAITGGKGGVGKTNVSVNLGVALSEMNRRVVIMDADLGLANIDILLGISSKYTIEDVLNGKRTLKEIMVSGPGGIEIVPASSGTQKMVMLSAQERAGLINAFNEIGKDIDVLIIDTAAGISETVVSFLKAAQEVMMVVCNEPTSITDAYALIKLLNQDSNLYRFHVLANMVRSQQEARDLFAKLVKVTDRFLDVALQFAGAIPYDDSLRKAVQRQKSVCDVYPRSKSAIAFKALAKKIDAWPLPSTPRGNLEFFVENLVQSVVPSS